MNVASLSFVLFCLAVAVVYNLGRPLAWRQAVLLVANLAFLSTFSLAPAAWLPYLAFLALGYGSHLLLRTRRRGSLAVCLFAMLGLFFLLKKYTFLPASLFLTHPYVTLGLSYVLFRVLHLLIDTYQGVLLERISPIQFLNYTLNFTAIISGPIQLYPDYARQQFTEERPSLDVIDLGRALERIVIGYFKINIMGLVFQTVQDRTLQNLPHTATTGLASRVGSACILGACYPLFLYFNFSGYTDVVLGFARGIRLTLPENFNRPFSAFNFLEFWSRWHMSLSSWLKTYVYSPLLRWLMVRFPNPALVPYSAVVCFFFTFFLVGVWHGRTSVFVVFGILQGLGTAMNKLYQIQMAKQFGKKPYKQLAANPVYQAVCRALTFTYFSFSMVWFWSNWQQMNEIRHNLGMGAIALGWLVVFVGALVLQTGYESLRNTSLSVEVKGTPMLLSRYTRVVWGTALAVVLIVALSVLSVPAPQVVYRGF